MLLFLLLLLLLVLFLTMMMVMVTTMTTMYNPMDFAVCVLFVNVMIESFRADPRIKLMVQELTTDLHLHDTGLRRLITVSNPPSPPLRARSSIPDSWTGAAKLSLRALPKGRWGEVGEGGLKKSGEGHRRRRPRPNQFCL